MSGSGHGPRDRTVQPHRRSLIMPAQPSFDVVSKVDRQEVDNALRQAEKELGTRFDFRGTGATIAWAGDEAVSLSAETEERVLAALDVFKEKLVKRNISLKRDRKSTRLNSSHANISYAVFCL